MVTQVNTKKKKEKKGKKGKTNNHGIIDIFSGFSSNLYPPGMAPHPSCPSVKLSSACQYHLIDICNALFLESAGRETNFRLPFSWLSISSH
jgi:hypothetical protein